MTPVLAETSAREKKFAIYRINCFRMSNHKMDARLLANPRDGIHKNITTAGAMV
jgi:hypothetical protein